MNKIIQRFISVVFSIVIILMISSEVLAVQYDGRIQLDKDGYTIEFNDLVENPNHNYQYTGAEVRPPISVVKLSVTGSHTNQKLSAGTDYKVSYQGNVGVGTGYLYVTGVGHYCGTLSARFYIYTNGSGNGSGSGSGNSNNKPELIITQPANGTITARPYNPSEYDWVTITATPNEGYTLEEIRINGEKYNSNGFSMPGHDVYVTAKFSRIDGDVRGECGDNLTWALSSDKQTLTISGTGEMNGWSDGGAPWDKNKTYIQTVVFSGDVTSIGSNAFKGCTNLSSVTIPDSVRTIDSGAFYGCSNLTSVIVPKGVKTVSGGAFAYCTKLTSIYIPSSMRLTWDSIVKDSNNLADVYYGGTVYSWNNVRVEPYYTNRPINTVFPVSTIHYSNEPKVSIKKQPENSMGQIGDTLTFSIEAQGVCLEYNWQSFENGEWKNCSGTGAHSTDYPVTITEALNGRQYRCVINNGFGDVITSDIASLIVCYTITGNSESAGGNIELSKTLAWTGEKIEISANPDVGYELDTIKVNGAAITGTTFTMGTGNTTVAATFKKSVYTVTVSETTNGSAKVDKTSASIDDEVTVTVTPAEGYELDTIKVNGTAIAGKTFTMGNANTTVDVTFKKIVYTVTVSKTANGSVTVDKSNASIGDIITVNATPDDGYEIDKIKVNETEITGKTFTMGAGDTTVTVTFIKHDLTAKAAKAPTCTDDGYEAYYECNRCHKLFSDSEGKHEISKPVAVSKLGHTWSDEGTETKAPTCEAEGVKTFSCTHDGCTATKDEPIKALGHSWDDGEVTQEPTCEESGVKTFHCTRSGCTETKTAPVKALGHKIVTVAEKAPTKTETGNIKHYKCERCGKLFSDANGKTEITQAQTVIPAMGHDLNEVKAKAATCTEPGNTDYYICKDDDCKCGKAYSDPYGQHEINIEDTVIPALGHNPVETAGKDPTCTEDGYEKYYKCSRCHKLFSDADGKNEIEKPVVVPKLGHDMKHYEAKKPTHDDDGHKEYYHCNRCGKNFADEDGKNALTDAEIVVPHIGAAVLGEEITDGDFKYKVTNPRTDGTGTVTLIGVENKTETVVIPATVELKLDTYKVNRIGTKAFYGNKTITSLSIGSNVVVIDSYAFYGCSNLVKVSGGKVLKTIGTKAFAYCSKLKSFSISSSVLNKIGSYAFQKDKKLKTVYIKYTTKLTKSGVKKSLKGSSVKTVKVKKSKVKKYKKYFKKSNSGRKVKVKK